MARVQPRIALNGQRKAAAKAGHAKNEGAVAAPSNEASASASKALFLFAIGLPVMLAPIRRLPSSNRQFSPSTQTERENHEQN
jgi:hypothetical protein